MIVLNDNDNYDDNDDDDLIFGRLVPPFPLQYGTSFKQQHIWTWPDMYLHDDDDTDDDDDNDDDS